MPEVRQKFRVEVFKSSGKWYTGEVLDDKHPFTLAVRAEYFNAADTVHKFCARGEFPILASGKVPQGWFVLINDETQYPVLVLM